jgi:hypothetical protein
VSISSGGVPSAPASIRLGGRDFTFVASLIPDHDASGAVEEFSPQGEYENRDAIPLHKHGHGTFCNFRISVPKGLVGVYALVVAGEVGYIGKCADLRERFGSRGYGTISPRNCYVKGQPTNCKINRRVLEVSQAGGRVDLYFYRTPERQTVEEQLIADCSPPWNG